MNVPSPSRSLRVVIADDDADTLVTLAAILEHEGHEVYGFGTGREALAAARMYKADVVLVDIQMPDMTGYDIARRVRENLADYPLVIAISGRWKSETDMLLSVSVGFDHYLTKPCDPEKLIEYLEEWRADQAARS